MVGSACLGRDDRETGFAGFRRVNVSCAPKEWFGVISDLAHECAPRLYPWSGGDCWAWLAERSPLAEIMESTTAWHSESHLAMQWKTSCLWLALAPEADATVVGARNASHERRQTRYMWRGVDWQGGYPESRPACSEGVNGVECVTCSWRGSQFVMAVVLLSVTCPEHSPLNRSFRKLLHRGWTTDYVDRVTCLGVAWCEDVARETACHAEPIRLPKAGQANTVFGRVTEAHRSRRSRCSRRSLALIRHLDHIAVFVSSLCRMRLDRGTESPDCPGLLGNPVVVLLKE